MNKQEFKEFCHQEFTKRGFKKRKSMYYLNGKDLLGGLYLQKSMCDAFYIEFDFFIGKYDDKSHPTHYESDLFNRFVVLSKTTYKGEYFMNSCIEYELYSKEELQPYFDETFDKYILPPILEGKKHILENLDYYFDAIFPKDRQKILDKLLDQSGDASEIDNSSDD